MSSNAGVGLIELGIGYGITKSILRDTQTKRKRKRKRKRKQRLNR